MSSAAIPVITVGFNLGTGMFTLHATSYGQTTPCGPRLFRAAPWPEMKFTHESQEAAEKDAATLRAYIQRTWSGAPSKAKLRKVHD